MIRDPETAQRRHHDLVIVGGGILGAHLLDQAARAGARALLLEKRDFGCGASANSLRILHGGLRYLQSMDFGRYFTSVADRRWYCRNFPEFIEPLACMMLLDGRGLRRRLVMSGALLANDLLSYHRNHGVARACRLDRGRTLSEAMLHAHSPETPDVFSAAALWHDARMTQPARLIIELIRRACESGGDAMNDMEVRQVETRSGHVAAVVATDRRTGTDYRFRTNRIINATGAAASAVARRLQPGPVPRLPLSLAWNVLVPDRLATRRALVVPSPNARFAASYVLTPSPGGTIIGTGQSIAEEPDPASPDPGQIGAFLEDLRAYFPAITAEPKDVLCVYAGCVPAHRAGSAEFASRPWITEHGDSGGPQGMVSAATEKFTTAPSLARRLLTRIGIRNGSNPMGPRRPSPGLGNRLALACKAQDEGYHPVEADVREFAALACDEQAAGPEDLVLRRLGVTDNPARASALCSAIATSGMS